MESSTNVSWKIRTQQERFLARNLKEMAFSFIKTFLVLIKKSIEALDGLQDRR